jgi:Caudovirales tail fibre assembly protein, lambda gpK
MSNQDDPVMQTYVWIRDGIVQNLISWDGQGDGTSSGWPIEPGDQLALLLDGQNPFIGYGATLGGDGVWVYAVPPPPVLTPAQILANNAFMQSTLLQHAVLIVTSLASASALGTITTDEAALLHAWQEYMVTVYRTDLTVQDQTWPALPS